MRVRYRHSILNVLASRVQMAQVPGERIWPGLLKCFPCLLLLMMMSLQTSLVPVLATETRECREQEYKDRHGNCMACKHCEAGQELSKECGFGYGEDAQCVACRPSRFKEDRGLQKCKPCLDCALLNRFQTGNCSATSNAVCGDCLPGFYRKTKLSGFLDMECIQCGDPPPPYEPHCSGRVNLVPITSTVTSPRDIALAAVICSALATVLLALLVLCVIYCKRQLLEKKPSGSLRSQEVPFCDAELACLDRCQPVDLAHRPCCHCHHSAHHGPAHNCGPVPLIPSLCCEDTCIVGRSGASSPFHSRSSLNEGHRYPSVGSSAPDLAVTSNSVWEAGPRSATPVDTEQNSVDKEEEVQCKRPDEEGNLDLEEAEEETRALDRQSPVVCLEEQMEATETIERSSPTLH